MQFCKTALIAFLLVVMSNPSFGQDIELSFYTGFQSSPHSSVEFDDGAGGGFDFTAGWEGHSLEPPPYYGLRGMFWLESGWGFGAEFTHAKVYGDEETLSATGFTTLEFTDGINILTANAFYRWDRPRSKWTPYAGAGLGISIPHVEVEGNGVSALGYQVTGPAVRLVGGISYDINDQWGAFTEYNGTYSMNDVDLGGGATMQTNIITNALNVGLTYSY